MATQSSDTTAAQCSLCGAPLPRVPSKSNPVLCDYCESLNVWKTPTRVVSEVGLIFAEEEEVDSSERDLILFQEFSDIMKEFPNTTHAGDALDKIRTVLPLPGRPEEILVILDDFPNSIYLDLPSRLEKAVGNFNSLETVKNWIPGSGHAVDVLHEIQDKATETMVQQVPSEASEIPSDQEIDDEQRLTRRPIPGWIRQVIDNFEAVQTSHPRLGIGVEANFYTNEGERCWIRVYPSDKPGRFLFQVDKPLQSIVLLKQTIEKHNAGTAAVIDVLAAAERGLIGVE